MNSNKNITIKLNALIFMGSLFINCLPVSAQDVSDEAKRFFARGVAAVEMAKSLSDYESAIKEFGQAVNLAPDWPDGYYNLGLVQEKAEKYDDAIVSLRQYLKLAPTAADAGDVKALIAKNEYKSEIFLREKEKVQSVLGIWGFKTTENEEIYSSIALTQNGKKIEFKRNNGQEFKSNEVFFDGTNMKFTYRMYDSFPKEWEVIVKWLAPGRFEGIVNQTILDTPHNDRRFDYLKGKKTTNSLIMIKQ